MAEILSYIPQWAKNKYFLTTLAFVLWMIFLDNFDLVTQWKRHQEISKIEAHIQYYKTEIVKTNEEKEALFGSMQNLEKFAREHYWMKKDNEDLFIVSNK